DRARRGQGKDLARQGRAPHRGRREAAQDQRHRQVVAELLAYLARELVDDPEAVRVETEERDGALVLLLHVAPDDVGKVIGRGGRIVRALRTIMRATAVHEGRRVLVEIAD